MQPAALEALHVTNELMPHFSSPCCTDACGYACVCEEALSGDTE